ncbi:MAG: valine--tRNA ligase [Deferribacteraceae bacterium]|jgi:valyl-tRNA synthetase|nr:valine--tRNA ligase [Deferribacteraceae bacterium]
MAKELAPRVNPKEYEESIYQSWLEKKLFHADEHSTKPSYSIVIPPPNVTGSLHMGHAFSQTLQDVLIRYHKLRGFEAMWLPGTDHAGIATQTVVERQLAAKGISRQELGREEFVKRVWEWKEESGNAIFNQMEKMGFACDWERTSFTMSDTLSAAVRKVFVTLYNKGLIYRANYMVNWCTHCHTALSDLEVEFNDSQDFLYHMKYPFADGTGAIAFATTRPETYLADTAVAVNPNDERFKHLIGKKVIVPLVNREIPIIGDEHVDMEFGEGALKVTPGHSADDFEIGKRHGLEELSCIDESGLITVPPFAGLTIADARKAIVNSFTELGLMGEIKPITHSVGVCYRCGTVVEPRISMQWFVKVKPLAEAAIEAVKRGDTKITPKAWEANYFEWMYNIRDWCISRQIWWGHRIPAWHCKACGQITVSEHDVDVCEHCGSANIHQETDVLDTWFSSALWPFSTMGWPNTESDTLKKFYPTTALVTAYDILFFWVARMMMMGIEFMGDVPFKDVYIHALVRDKDGQKMSKTKGNVIDPLVMVDKYGADAFRFALTAFAAQGRDIRLSEDRIEGYRNFVNKIWNASRFIFMNMGEGIPAIDASALRDEDKWILTKLAAMSADVGRMIEGYNFNEAAASLYQFFWMYFCDWYVELIKERFFKDDAKEAAIATAGYVLEKALIAMHPVMPFVTEHIWQALTGGDSIMRCSWPEQAYIYEKETADIDAMIELIGLIRNIRGEYNVNPGQQLEAVIITDNASYKALFNAKADIIKRIARLSNFDFVLAAPDAAASQVHTHYTVYVPLSGLVDKEAELARLNKELKALDKDYTLYSGKLKNEKYLAKAAPEIIEKDRNKLAELELQIAKVNEAIKGLS